METNSSRSDIEIARVREEITALKVEIARLREQLAATKEAYVNDLIELRRRLEELNHAHANAVLDRGQFLLISIHDRFYTEYNHWRDEVNSALAIRVLNTDFNSRVGEMAKWRDEVNHGFTERVSETEFKAHIAEYDKWNQWVSGILNNWAGRTYGAVAILGIVFTIVQILLHYWQVSK